MGRRLERLVTGPELYAGWAILVVVALYATYRTDPYVFGFTALGLAWLTGGLALVGLLACLLSRTARPAAKAVIVASLVVAAGAIAKALAVLRTFHWA